MWIWKQKSDLLIVGEVIELLEHHLLATSPSFRGKVLFEYESKRVFHRNSWRFSFVHEIIIRVRLRNMEELEKEIVERAIEGRVVVLLSKSPMWKKTVKLQFLDETNRGGQTI